MVSHSMMVPKEPGAEFEFNDMLLKVKYYNRLTAQGGIMICDYVDECLGKTVSERREVEKLENDWGASIQYMTLPGGCSIYFRWRT